MYTSKCRVSKIMYWTFKGNNLIQTILIEYSLTKTILKKRKRLWSFIKAGKQRNLYEVRKVGFFGKELGRGRFLNHCLFSGSTGLSQEMYKATG